jgi:hypothetical protein
VAALAALLASCSSAASGAPTTAPSLHVHTDNTSLGRPDHVIAGPQGAVPQFVVECLYSHAREDDPIVHPRQPGASHLHVFFGNEKVDAYTTVASLAGNATTCDQQLDKAAYWAPALLRNSTVLTPLKSTAYYRPGIDVDPTVVQPFPKGLMMVAGNAGALAAQPESIVAWSCGAGIERSTTPPVCAEQRNLRLIVTFPDCWDGTHLDSPDHHAHIAYSSKGRCPDGFHVSIPQLQFEVEYPVSGPTDGLELSSGGLLSGHADFMNGWDEARLTTEVDLCLHRKVVCSITSGRKTG